MLASDTIIYFLTNLKVQTAFWHILHAYIYVCNKSFSCCPYKAEKSPGQETSIYLNPSKVGKETTEHRSIAVWPRWEDGETVNFWRINGKNPSWRWFCWQISLRHLRVGFYNLAISKSNETWQLLYLLSLFSSEMKEFPVCNTYAW